MCVCKNFLTITKECRKKLKKVIHSVIVDQFVNRKIHIYIYDIDI